MNRIQITAETPLIQGSATAMLLSIEGGQCRLYMGEVPENAYAGHYVQGGYQIIVPAGVDVFATSVAGSDVAAVVGPFGV